MYQKFHLEHGPFEPIDWLTMLESNPRPAMYYGGVKLQNIANGIAGRLRGEIDTSLRLDW